MKKRLERFVEWLKDPCTWGRHNWLVVRKGRCKAHVGSVLGGYMGKTDCRVEVYVCGRCHKKDASIFNGIVSQKMDADFVTQELDAINPATPHDVMNNIQRWNTQISS